MRINLTDHIDIITMNVERGGKEEILKDLVDLALPGETESSREEALTLIMEREALGSTAIGGGLALPHAGVGFLKRSHTVMAVFRNGVEFDSEDGRPVYAVFLLLGPPINQVLHLQILAKIARLFKHIKLPGDLRNLDTPEDVAEFLGKIEKSHS